MSNTVSNTVSNTEFALLSAPSSLDEYLTVAEAAQLLRTTTEALRMAWRRRGLPLVKFGPRRVLLRREDVLAQLRQQSAR